jgi:ribosome-interacting GTPase 1
MPINAGPEYAKAQEEYFKASTTEEKIGALKNMISKAPKHKSSEKLLQNLKNRLADLKKAQIKEKKAGKGKRFAIKKEGAATVVFISVPDSGKSKLFSNLTEMKYGGENNYTTKMRMIPYENVWLQGIDLPAFYANFSESSDAAQIFGLIRTADVLVMVANDEPELKILESELKKAGITFGAVKRQDINLITIPVIAVSSDSDINELKESIWQKSGKIRVQTKTKAGVAPKPVVLKKGATIKELAQTIHHDFVRNFKYAKVWGKSARFAGQSVGFGHKLADKDVVEVFTK